MSSSHSEDTDAPSQTFRGVNGNCINLYERNKSHNVNVANANGVIKFVLDNESPIEVKTNLLLFCLSILLWSTTGSLILVVVSILALTLHLKHVVTSVTTGNSIISFFF